MAFRISVYLLLMLFVSLVDGCATPSSLAEKLDDYELRKIAYSANVTYTHPAQFSEALRYTSADGESLLIMGPEYWSGRVTHLGNSEICYRYDVPRTFESCEQFVKNGNKVFVIADKYAHLNEAYIHIFIEEADRDKVITVLRHNLQEKEKQDESVKPINYVKAILRIGEGIVYSANAVVGFARSGVAGMLENVAERHKEISRLNMLLDVYAAGTAANEEAGQGSDNLSVRPANNRSVEAVDKEGVNKMSNERRGGTCGIEGAATWSDGSKAGPTVSISTSWNSQKGVPRNGWYELDLGPEACGKSITVYDNGKHGVSVKLPSSGNARHDVWLP